jgi:hypothetical protein
MAVVLILSVGAFSLLVLYGIYRAEREHFTRRPIIYGELTIPFDMETEQ